MQERVGRALLLRRKKSHATSKWTKKIRPFLVRRDCRSMDCFTRSRQNNKYLFMFFGHSHGNAITHSFPFSSLLITFCSALENSGRIFCESERGAPSGVFRSLGCVGKKVCVFVPGWVDRPSCCGMTIQIRWGIDPWRVTDYVRMPCQ